MKKGSFYILIPGFLFFFLQGFFVFAEGKTFNPQEAKFSTCLPYSPDTIFKPHPGRRDSLLLDSLLRVSRNASEMKFVRFLAEGKIPVGYFNILYSYLFNYNLFEGIKLGMGAETNRRLTKYGSLSGYFTYGLRDNRIHPGTWLDIYPKGYYDFRITFGYKDINLEFGQPEFLEKPSLLKPESYRLLLIENMYNTRRFTLGMELRPVNDLDTYLYADRSENFSRPTNTFLDQHPFPELELFRVGLQFRYSPGIELVRDPYLLIEKTVPGSDWFLTTIQGLNWWGGDYRYSKIEFKGRYLFHFTRGSNTKMILRTGYISRNAPLIELFNGYGSYVSAFSFIAPYSFNTMRQNEFAASEFAAIHLRHEFGINFYAPEKKFKPIFVLAQNIGYGYLDPSLSSRYQMSDFHKGFFESGLEVNNLLRMDFLSWGVGVYYRYGPYQLPVFSDNLAYKFGFFINM